MKVRDTRRITIVGAGLAGTLLAVLLSRRGFELDLFERNPDPRKGNAPAGRSINLALAERGRHALNEAGLLETVDRFTIAMRGRMLHDIHGQLTLQPYGKDESEVIWSTHRALLNSTMLDAAEATGKVRIHFNHQLEGVDWDRKVLQFLDTLEADFEILIGADGGGSAARRAMADATDIGIREDILDHGYRELTIPTGAGGGFALDPNALHIWPRGGFMLIALPNSDQSFTVTLFLANQGEPSFETLGTRAAQEAFLRAQFPDVHMLMSNLQEDFELNPVGLLGTIRCANWHYRDQAVLLGDAAHGMVPFHGQGMNAAFEDCVELMCCLEDRDKDWQQVFSAFEQRRIANANAIADMALENYQVMREAVQNPRFLLRKALEHELERQHPDRFVARYSLVMFHRIPYVEAFRRGEIQADMLEALLEGVNSLEDVDFDNAARLIDEQLEKIKEP